MNLLIAGQRIEYKRTGSGRAALDCAGEHVSATVTVGVLI